MLSGVQQMVRLMRLNLVCGLTVGELNCFNKALSQSFIFYVLIHLRKKRQMIKLVFNPSWTTVGFRKSDPMSDEQIVVTPIHSQAHLHVCKVEEAVHVSRGRVFVLGDKNLCRGEKKQHNIS